MLEQASILIFIVIALALIFDFVNGFHDTANAIATCVSTRAVSPAVAIIMSAILNFAGAMYRRCQNHRWRYSSICFYGK